MVQVEIAPIDRQIATDCLERVGVLFRAPRISSHGVPGLLLGYLLSEE